MWAAVIGGVAGLASGVVASVIAPWASWRIEKKRRELDRKYELLDRWRTGISEFDSENYKGAFGTEWYETLRPYLSPAVLALTERPRTVVVDPGTGRALRNRFAEEVDRIEHHWKLDMKPADSKPGDK